MIVGRQRAARLEHTRCSMGGFGLLPWQQSTNPPTCIWVGHSWPAFIRLGSRPVRTAAVWGVFLAACQCRAEGVRDWDKMWTMT